MITTEPSQTSLGAEGELRIKQTSNCRIGCLPTTPHVAQSGTENHTNNDSLPSICLVLPPPNQYLKTQARGDDFIEAAD